MEDYHFFFYLKYIYFFILPVIVGRYQSVKGERGSPRGNNNGLLRSVAHGFTRLAGSKSRHPRHCGFFRNESFRNWLYHGRTRVRLNYCRFEGYFGHLDGHPSLTSAPQVLLVSAIFWQMEDCIRLQGFLWFKLLTSPSFALSKRSICRLVVSS